MASDTSVAIVDDDKAVRHSTVRLIERAGHGARTFKSGDDFLAQLPKDLDCVLLDMQMPGRSGLDVLKVLAGRDDAPWVIVVTGRGDIGLAAEAMRFGAADYLEKPYAPAALLAAIDYACELHARPQAAWAARREAVARIKTLSRRQRQVLRGLVKGTSNKIIADELGLSVRTVEACRAQVLIKLGVRSTPDAVRIALAGDLDTGCTEA